MKTQIYTTKTMVLHKLFWKTHKKYIMTCATNIWKGRKRQRPDDEQETQTHIQMHKI